MRRKPSRPPSRLGRDLANLLQAEIQNNQSSAALETQNKGTPTIIPVMGTCKKVAVVLGNSKSWFRVQGDWNHHRSAEQVECSEFHGIAVLGREQKNSRSCPPAKKLEAPHTSLSRGPIFFNLYWHPDPCLSWVGCKTLTVHPQPEVLGPMLPIPGSRV